MIPVNLAPSTVLAAVTLVVALLVTACQTSTEVLGLPDPTAEVRPSEETTSTESSEVDDVSPSAQADASESETDEMSTPSEVFEIARESIVFVGNPLESRGSGVVLDDGWILTNAHVVGRAREVRVVSSDGEELGQLPIHGVDPVLDLAVLGPLDQTDLSPTPVSLAVSADVQTGETVYLLGYPDENNTVPEPTLTEGIVNRRRSIELLDYSFFQVDASIAPGQSGGALLDDEGRLIGLSGIRFGEGAFGLALETDSLVERVQMLIDGPPLADLFDGQPVESLDVVLGPQRFVAFMIDSDGQLEVEVNSAADMFIEVLSAAGARKFDDWEGWDYFVDLPRTKNDYFRDDTVQGAERLRLAVEPGPYQVLVGSFDSSPAAATITSASPFYLLPDAEEGDTLAPDEVREGEFGWSKDSDKWVVPLNAGDTAKITIDGLGDVFGVVRLDGIVVASNDDAGFGVFGLGSKIEFTAVEDGDYELEVGTRDLDRHGYFVLLEIF